MEFCPKCGGLMVPISKKTLECPKCGKKVRTDGIVMKEKIEKKAEKKQRGKPKEIKDTMPTIDDTKCPKCGNKEAYWWTMQTRAADEPETQFYRCKKCNHTWREYL